MLHKAILTSDLHYGHTQFTHDILDEFFAKMAKKEKPDLLIIAGDIVSHSPKEVEPCLAMLRSRIQCPILAVLGNHDWWAERMERKSLSGIVAFYKELFSKYDITWLSNNPYKIKGVDTVVLGFDGWYTKADPDNTNDCFWMDKETMKALHKKANSDIKKIVAAIKAQRGSGPFPMNRTIVVTHFDFDGHSAMSGDPAFIDALSDAGVDMVLCGHSHKARLDIYDTDKRIGPSWLNAGGDYDSPKYITMVI